MGVIIHCFEDKFETKTEGRHFVVESVVDVSVNLATSRRWPTKLLATQKVTEIHLLHQERVTPAPADAMFSKKDARRHHECCQSDIERSL